MSTQPFLSLKGVSKSYGQINAVDDLSLQLAEGEFFALLGPSGCGKTTLLRMIAGFEQPDCGSIVFDGVDINPIPANKRPFNLMFQSYALFPHMTVRKNIAYGLEMEKRSKSDIASRVNDILEKTKLIDYSDRKPHLLSGGQRQRVALARALVKRPRILLLDEPLGALDKNLREEMQLELKRLQHEIGITFVVVTHDQEEALVMADRVALMNYGKIEQLAVPSTLYESPVNRFVAQFIGSTNLLEGIVVKDAIEIEGLGTIKIPADTKRQGPCSLSIRPERIFLSNQRLLDNINSFSGIVTDIAYTGQDRHFVVALKGSSVLLKVRVAENQAESNVTKQGDTVWCNWYTRHERVLNQ